MSRQCRPLICRPAVHKLACSTILKILTSLMACDASAAGEVRTDCHAEAHYQSMLQAAGLSCTANFADTPAGIEFGCPQDMSGPEAFPDAFPRGTTKADICPELCGCPAPPPPPPPPPAPPPPAPPHGETWTNGDCMQDEAGWTEPAAGLTCAQIGQQRHTCAGHNAYWIELRRRCPFSCGLCITAAGAISRRPEATLNPTGSCGPLWQADEMPQVYELDLQLPQADFADLVGNQVNLPLPSDSSHAPSPRTRRLHLTCLRVPLGQARSYDAAITKVTTVVFNGTPLQGAKIQVHGGKYERGGGNWDASTVHENSGLGADCYLRGVASASYKCKPSFRLQFSDASPLSVALAPPREDGFLFRYPASKQTCNTSPSFLNLRGEFNDPVMLRNKLTMDLIKHAGGLAPRIEYGR